MISFDLECSKEHRFEGIFKDYRAFDDQLCREMIECPVCGDLKIKRLFTGCSIQTGQAVSPNATLPDEKANASPPLKENAPNVFELVRRLREFVVSNYENVGKDFADKAKAMHYGIEEHKNIYGESTPQEIKELVDEGINVLPIPSVDKLEN